MTARLHGSLCIFREQAPKLEISLPILLVLGQAMGNYNYFETLSKNIFFGVSYTG